MIRRSSNAPANFYPQNQPVEALLTVRHVRCPRVATLVALIFGSPSFR